MRPCGDLFGNIPPLELIQDIDIPNKAKWIALIIDFLADYPDKEKQKYGPYELSLAYAHDISTALWRLYEIQDEEDEENEENEEDEEEDKDVVYFSLNEAFDVIDKIKNKNADVYKLLILSFMKESPQYKTEEYSNRIKEVYKEIKNEIPYRLQTTIKNLITEYKKTWFRYNR